MKPDSKRGLCAAWWLGLMPWLCCTLAETKAAAAVPSQPAEPRSQQTPEGGAPRAAQADSPVPWPRVGVTYSPLAGVEEDFRQLAEAGVGLADVRVRSASEARRMLAAARRSGIKLTMRFAEVTEDARLVRRFGLEPVPALMIGGVYQGKAIDRHVFRFAPTRHSIIIEPPVYNARFAYQRTVTAPDGTATREPMGHYFPEMPAPLRAEVIVPLKRYDGKQHLRIVPAVIRPAAADAQPEHDSVGPALPQSSETATRQLYALQFDLTGLDDALLDQVGLAVYWPYHGFEQYWMFGHGCTSAYAPSTREAVRREVRRVVGLWSEADDGRFPADVVVGARFGDECFYVTSHVHTGAPVSYPLWDYSQPAFAAFRARAGQLEYPRTWGFPEIYGPAAYAWWLYTLHKGCAELCEVVREQLHEAAPGVRVFRNTTRMGVFDPANDHDGSGQELLAQALDVIHLDPYPVHARGYSPEIPRDMSYLGGLARRYARPLVPWMQSHTYAPGSLTHVGPKDVARMADEQWAQGVDGVIWLGWGRGYTFPQARAESWQAAVTFHRRLAEAAPQKPEVRLAVLRPYTARALCSLCEDGRVRNPADWLLAQWLEVWAVGHGRPYDVFELGPEMDAAQREALAQRLGRYRWIVTTEPWPGAWVLGEGTAGTSVAAASAAEVQRRYESEMRRRGWLGGAMSGKGKAATPRPNGGPYHR